MTAPLSQWPKSGFREGQRYPTLDNPKVVIHTTEGVSLPSYPWPPHITYDPTRDLGWRHTNFDQGSFALKSPGGGQSPNYQGGPAFQIEIIGFAKDGPSRPDWWYERVGDVISQACVIVGAPAFLHPKGFIGGQAYGEKGPNRISWDNYKAFSGVLGHQHVPFNTHWDPGNLDEKKLTEAIVAKMIAGFEWVDYDEWPYWAKESITKNIEKGYIRGIAVPGSDTKKRFEPERPLTRAEAAVLLDRVGHV